MTTISSTYQSVVVVIIASLIITVFWYVDKEMKALHANIKIIQNMLKVVIANQGASPPVNTFPKSQLPHDESIDTYIPYNSGSNDQELDVNEAKHEVMIENCTLGEDQNPEVVVELSQPVNDETGDNLSIASDPLADNVECDVEENFMETVPNERVEMKEAVVDTPTNRVDECDDKVPVQKKKRVYKRKTISTGITV